MKVHHKYKKLLKLNDYLFLLAAKNAIKFSLDLNTFINLISIFHK